MIKALKNALSCLMVILIALPPVTAMADSAEIKRSELSHPFLFVNYAGGFEGMRERSEGTLAEVYSALKSEADEACARGALAYYESESEEENWMRDEADTIFKLTLVYKISNEEKYKTAAWEYITAACGYPSWGRGTAHKNCDLACAHMLTAFSVYYDWLFDELGETEKTLIKNTVQDRANAMYTADDNHRAWWRFAYLQNHMWVCCSALEIASAVFWDDLPEAAANWAEFANEKMQTAYRYMPKDGSLHEGAMYFRYGMTFLRYFNITADECFGMAEYKNSEHMKNAGYFLMNMLLPMTNDGDNGERYGKVYNFSDSPRLSSSEYVSLLYSFANDYNAPEMRYIADLHRERAEENLKSGSEAAKAAAGTALRGMWQSLIFAQTEGDSEKPSQESFNRVFDELGYVFSRSGLTDMSASGFAVRCGSLLGNEVLQNMPKYDPGLSHIHADVNSLLIYAGGQLLLTDDGYDGGYTESHNTLTVNGTGQLGDGKSWDISYISKYTPSIVKWESNDRMTYVVCDGTAAYSPETGLKKYRRHILFIKPNVLIAADEIETDEALEKSNLELRFFPLYQNGRVMADGSFFFGENRNAKMYVKSDDSGAAIEKTVRNPGTDEVQTVSIKHSGNSWTPVTAFIFGTADESLPEVTVKRNENGYTAECIKDGIAEEYSVDLENAQCEVRGGDVYVLESGVSALNGAAVGTARVKNLLTEPQTVRLILGIYNEQEILTDTAISELSFLAGEEKDIEVKTVRKLSDSEHARLFIWLDNMKPCAVK